MHVAQWCLLGLLCLPLLYPESGSNFKTFFETPLDNDPTDGHDDGGG